MPLPAPSPHGMRGASQERRRGILEKGNRSVRRIIAWALMSFYLAISLGPSALLALSEGRGAHAAVRSCSGDCDVCGCSPAARSAGTCCCSRSRQLAVHRELSSPSCCQQGEQERETVIAACGCPWDADDERSFPGAKKTEILPHYFASRLDRLDTAPSYPSSSARFSSRVPEPPDPPPRLG